MASLWRRAKSKFWVGCYTAADGRQLKRSTRETDKRKALLVVQAWEELEGNSARGYLSSEEQFRLFVAQKYRLLFGKDAQSDLTVRAWLEGWLLGEKGAVGEATLERYTQVVRDFLAFLGSRASLRLEALSSADAIAYRDRLLGAGQTPGNVNQQFRILSKPFRQAWQEGRINRNPIAGVRHLRHQRAEKGTFSPEQILKLLAAAPEPEWQTLILLGYYTGGRLMDLVGLKWDSIDLAEGSLCFTQKKTAHHGPKAKLKIPLHPELSDHLLTLSAPDNSGAPLLPQLSQVSGSGRQGLSMTFRQIMLEAGIDPGIARERIGAAGRSVSRLSFHALRHSFISALANAGVPSEVRQKLSGHADDMSHAGYSHHEFTTVKEALEKLGRLPREGAGQ